MYRQLYFVLLLEQLTELSLLGLEDIDSGQ
jgi:hypothetical protein